MGIARSRSAPGGRPALGKELGGLDAYVDVLVLVPRPGEARLGGTDHHVGRRPVVLHGHRRVRPYS